METLIELYIYVYIHGRNARVYAAAQGTFYNGRNAQIDGRNAQLLGRKALLNRRKAQHQE